MCEDSFRKVFQSLVEQKRLDPETANYLLKKILELLPPSFPQQNKIG